MLEASEENATNLRSAEMEGKKEYPFPGLPAESTETRVVVLVNKSRTKMSSLLLVSPGTRLVELDKNATNRPSAEMEGEPDLLFLGLPDESTETRVVVLVNKSRTKMSV